MNEVRSASSAGGPDGKTIALTAAALVCFALNSLLCRAALGARLIDATSFTSLRLMSGAAVLMFLASRKGAWLSGVPNVPLRERALQAASLFFYALPFSLAYLRLSAGTGAFVVFGCVQITMIGSGLIAGQSLRWREGLGLALALGGLFWLTRPGAESPDPVGVLLMAIAGVAWGTYSLRGRRTGPPLTSTARNFAATVPLTLIASAFAIGDVHFTARGAGFALASGAITSGLGYVAWYAALPSLSATRASILQLAVPPLASAFGVIFLGETPSPRMLTAAPLILGGIAIAVAGPKHRAT